MWILLFLLGVGLLSTAQAEPQLNLVGRFEQGGFIIGQTDKDAEVILDGRLLRLTPDGKFAFGFGRDFPAYALLRVTAKGEQLVKQLTIAKRSYDIQRIEGLPEAQVTPPPQVLTRIHNEAENIKKLRERDSDLTGFLQSWIWPAKGPVSGVYGSQRILNGEPRQPHYGVDIAADVGAPVVAAANGQIVLAAPDLYFTGGTIVIDHGHGVSAVYSHLSEIAVQLNQKVDQGQMIGKVGATGRATGPHLDFRINWFEQRLDPQMILPPYEAEQ